MRCALPTETVIGRLCLHCGICCNGVLFKDVVLQPGDHLPVLGALAKNRPTAGGIASATGRRNLGKLAQPCQALEADGRCCFYEDRPRRCREFECLLFHSVREGVISSETALKRILQVQHLADQVRQGLRALGDNQEKSALSVRFRKMRQRADAGLPRTEAALFGELTLAVHDLNLELRQSFLP